MKWLVNFDSYEEEPKGISYVELSHDDNVELRDKQESCAVGDNARGGFDIICCIQTTLLQPISRQTSPRSVFLIDV
jgi:hypothetical protein